MNLVYGHVEGSGDDVWAVLPDNRLKIDKRAIEAHPGLESYVGKEIVVGVRPSSLEAAAIAGANADRTLTANVEVTEMLGADTFVHFTVNRSPVITPDIEELLADSGRDSTSLGDKTNFVARVSPDIDVNRGDTVDLVVDTSKLHFFDQDTGERIGAEQPAAAATV